uniref:Gypsy retrotransposon integrase-like protein 1 n=1 Tax=Petromyzon marinus TaxID=7757 RepID=A0AAJ7U467_PETMA|nr:uncharacterized protein LOC116953358 [Petromyzon marinus]
MRWDGGLRCYSIVVHKELMGKLIVAMHECLMHLGVCKTLATLRLDLFWPGMSGDVYNVLKGCTQCARQKPPLKMCCWPLQSIRVSRIKELVTLDVLGPFRPLVGVEYFSRWPMAWLIPNQSAAVITEAFLHGYVLDKRAPERLLTDQGKTFSLKLLKEVCDLLGTKKVRTSPYHPQTDEMVERLHRTLTSMLSQQVSKSQGDWDLHIPGVLAAYRTAPHASTGFSPFFCMYGREQDPPIESNLRRGRVSLRSTCPSTCALPCQASRHNSASWQWANERLRRLRVSGRTWAPGDKAWLHCPQVPVGTSPKLYKPWRGPVDVIQADRPQCVKIQFGRWSWFVHPSRLKPFVAPRVSPLSPLPKGRVSSVPEELRKASAEVVPQGNSVPPTGPKRLTSSPDESTTDAQHGADRPSKSRSPPTVVSSRAGPRPLGHVQIPTRSPREPRPTSPGGLATRTRSRTARFK